MIPGTSRSGATIMGALAMGVGRKTAAEFSFFLAVPTMLGAATVKILDDPALLAGEATIGWSEIAFGFTAAFRSGAGGYQGIRRLCQQAGIRALRLVSYSARGGVHRLDGDLTRSRRFRSAHYVFWNGCLHLSF